VYFLLDESKVEWDVFDDFGWCYRTNAEKLNTDGSLPDWNSYIEIVKGTNEVIFIGDAINAIEMWIERGVCCSLLINV
jgi:hypothetical protein